MSTASIDPSSASPSSRFTRVTPPPTTPTTSGPLDAARRAAIVADLDRRGVATEPLEVVSVRSITWNDGSLGCPEPGRSYSQALVPGSEVIVDAGGVRYDYHFGSGDALVLCTRPHATVRATND